MLLLVFCSGTSCQKQLQEDVPQLVQEVVITTPYGKLTVFDRQDFPIPPLGDKGEEQARGLIERAANEMIQAGTLQQNQKQTFVNAQFQNVNTTRIYGVGIRFEFESAKDGKIHRVRCPRFIQLARGKTRITFSDSSVSDKSFADVAAESQFKADGGTTHAEGWFVDRRFVSPHPVFETLIKVGLQKVTVPFIAQEWGEGFAKMRDVPGIDRPWQGGPLNNPAKFNNSTWEVRKEFESWIVGPKVVVDREGTVTFPPQEACNGPFDQPPATQRTPFGFVQWSFVILIQAGTGKNSTSAQYVVKPSYAWVNSSGNDIYKFLMQNNAAYSGWVPN